LRPRHVGRGGGACATALLASCPLACTLTPLLACINACAHTRAHGQTQVWCPMTPAFMSAYLDSKARQRKSLWIMNPNKLAAVEHLVLFWELRGHKIIVFSDDLTTVQLYSYHLKRQCMTGAVLPAFPCPMLACPASPCPAHSFSLPVAMLPSALPSPRSLPKASERERGQRGAGWRMQAECLGWVCAGAGTCCVDRVARLGWVGGYASAERRTCARGAAVQIPRQRFRRQDHLHVLGLPLSLSLMPSLSVHVHVSCGLPLSPPQRPPSHPACPSFQLKRGRVLAAARRV